MKALKVKRKKIEDLLPADYNPRVITAEAFEGLQNSIDKFGMVQPIIWNKRSGNIVGGHQRVEVLLAKNEKETDVIVVDLPESEEKALNVTLNSHAIAGDFTEDINTLLAEIKDELPQLYDDLILDDLIMVDICPADSKEVSFLAKDSGPPIAKPGDIWDLGCHRLTCGDSDVSECDILIKRWESHTGKKAVLSGS